ncbi:MAG: glycoside hydrolase family 3 N-terminal domain-containing protein [Gloeomargarita sp. HHBFW_bins_162]
MVGQRLLLGAPPGAIGADALALLQKTGAMGLILFRSQVSDPQALPHQLAWLRERLGRPVVIAIDHEGGQVIRHLGCSTMWPGNYALGRAAQRDLSQAEGWAEQVGQAMGWELRRLGIGWNLAPVLDVVGEEPNPGLGLRAFGNEGEVVARLGVAMLKGLQQAGIVACGKHFPGLGRARVDPHHELPRLDLTRSELENHWQPFRAVIEAGLPAVMTTHVLVPALDEDNVITLSRLAIQKYLRRELNFTGVCVSDDLDMGAMRGFGCMEEITRKTLQAGHDIALIGHVHQEPMTEIINMLLQEELPEAAESLTRIAKITTQADIAQVLPPTQDWQPAELLAEAITQAAVRVVRDPQGWLPVQLPVRLYLPDVTPVADWVLFEPCWFDANAMKNLLGIPTAEVITTFLHEPTALALDVPRVNQDIVDIPGIPGHCPALGSQESGDENLTQSSDECITNILLLYDAIRYPGQQQALTKLAQSGQPLVVVIVRNPWDDQHIPQDITVIDATGFRSPQLRQVGRLLRGLV